MDETRLRNENARLRQLEAASRGIVRIRSTANLRHYDIVLRVAAPVGADEHYAVEHEHHLSLDLTDNFPEAAPVPRFSRPILAPNIWSSGVPCIVSQNWHPSRHLDQVVCDVIEEMQGIDPNWSSVANQTAAELYRSPGFVQQLRQRLGPVVRLAPPAMSEEPAAQTSPPSSRIRSVRNTRMLATGSRPISGTARRTPGSGISTVSAPPPRQSFGIRTATSARSPGSGITTNR